MSVIHRSQSSKSCSPRYDTWRGQWRLGTDTRWLPADQLAEGYQRRTINAPDAGDHEVASSDSESSKDEQIRRKRARAERRHRRQEVNRRTTRHEPSVQEVALQQSIQRSIQQEQMGESRAQLLQGKEEKMLLEAQILGQKLAEAQIATGSSGVRRGDRFSHANPESNGPGPQLSATGHRAQRSSEILQCIHHIHVGGGGRGREGIRPDFRR